MDSDDLYVRSLRENGASERVVDAAVASTTEDTFVSAETRQAALGGTHALVMIDACDDYAEKCEADGDVEVAALAREAAAALREALGQ